MLGGREDLRPDAADGRGVQSSGALRRLGGLLLIGPADGFLEDVLLVIAIAFGTINVVGGFLVTDRMLGMFKNKPAPADAGASVSEKADPQVAAAEETKQLP